MRDTLRLREQISAAIFVTGLLACGNEPAPVDPGAGSSRTGACLPGGIAIRFARADMGPNAETSCPAGLDPRTRGSSPDWPRDLQTVSDDPARLDSAETQRARASGLRDACCYQQHAPMRPVPGRALVAADGRLVTPAIAMSTEPYPGGGDLEELPGALRAAIGDAWLADARLEHASVASFARTTIELLAHAAPPELVIATQQASIDEIEHARLCFALASAYLGKRVSPAALEACMPRGGSLADFAQRTFAEACVGETIAALVAQRALEGCDDRAREALTVIASDESRHAELAWSTLAWCVREGGASVVDALSEMGREGRTQTQGRQNLSSPHGDDVVLARHGRLSPEAETIAAHDAWREIISPMLDQLLCQNV